VFTAPADVLHTSDNNPLKLVLGPNSLFGLDEDEHLRARRIVLPPFHGERMGTYADVFEEETLAEMKSWPMDRDFKTTGPMMRITLNSILRTVFGAQGEDLEILRKGLPRWVRHGAMITVSPLLRMNLGPMSPWGRHLAHRREYDAVVQRLIDTCRRDPKLAERTDVLALLVQARYEDGSEMTLEEIADQLLTILTAGHETTAGSLAWAIERLRRHPQLLAELTEEAHAGGNELRLATVTEVQRIRPVILGAFRCVMKPFELGEWLLPPGSAVTVDTKALHNNPQLFPDPERFSPKRFVGEKPSTYAWVPFGGGRRRCVGAAFAQLEMDVVLKTILTRCDLVPTSEPDEKPLYRGISVVPRKGGLARVRAFDFWSG
ncbi:MAG: cytochrome P450, partial [Thermomicrobiales bacterium]